MSLNSILWGDIGLDDTTQSIRRKNTVLSDEEVDRISSLASKKHNIGKDIVRAVIDIESGDYNPKATNKDSSAKGLMQLIDGTAKDMGVVDAFDPVQNVMGGARYLRTLLDQYNGDEESAVMAFFKGPVAVNRAIRKGLKPSQIGGTLGGTTANDYWTKYQKNKAKYQGSLNTDVVEGLSSTEEPNLESNKLRNILFGDIIGPQNDLKPEMYIPDLTVESNKKPVEAIEQKPISEMEFPLPKLSSDPDVAKLESQFFNAPDSRSKASILKSLPQDKTQGLLSQLPETDQQSVSVEMDKLTNERREGQAFAQGILNSTPFPILFPDEAKAEMKAVKEAAPVRSNLGQAAGTVAQAFIGGAAFGKLATKIPVISKSPLLRNVFTRVATGTAIGAEQSFGRDDVGTAITNTLQAGGGGLVSIIPELVAPAGVAQLIAQPLGDLIYDVTMGAIREDQDVTSKEWWINEISGLALSMGFAIKDVSSGNTFKMERASQRKEFGNWMKGKGREGIEIVKATDVSSENPRSDVLVKGEPVGRTLGEVDNEASVRDMFVDDINAKQEADLKVLDSELNPPPEKPLSRNQRRAMVESGMDEDPVIIQMREKYGEAVPSKKQVAQDFGVSREKASQMIKQSFGETSQPSSKVVEKEPEQTILPPRWEQKEKVVESGTTKPIQSGLTTEEIAGINGKQNELPGSKKESGSGKQGGTGIVGKVPQKPVEPKPDIADADWVKLKEEIHDDSYPTEYEEWFKNLSEKEQEDETYRAWADENPKVYDEVRQQELGLGKTENPEDPVALGKEANRLMRKIRKEVSALSVSGKDKKSIEDYILGRSSDLPPPEVMKKYKQSLESGLVTELEVLRLEGNVQGKEYLNSQGEWDYDGVHRMIQDNYKSSATYGRKLGVREKKEAFEVGETTGGFTSLKQLQSDMEISGEVSGILRPVVDPGKSPETKTETSNPVKRTYGPEIAELFKAVSGGETPKVLDQLNTASGQALGLANGKKIYLKGDIFIGPLKAAVASKGKQKDFEIAVIKKEITDSGVKESEIVVKEKGGIAHIYVRDPDYAEQVFSHEVGHVISGIRHLDGEVNNLTPKQLLKEGIGPKIIGIADGIKDYVGAKGAEVIDQLKHLTGIWNPFNPKASKAYTNYRYNPEELYADAVSAMLVHPELVAKEAPEFYKGFLNYMENRPELKDSWDSIQGRTDDEIKQNRIDRELESFREGDAIRKKEMEDRLKGPKGSVVSDIKKAFLSYTEPLLKRRKEVLKNGGKIDAENDPLYFIEELKYISGPAKAMLSDVDTKIGASLEKAGLTNEDLGLYLAYKRQSTELVDKPGAHGVRDKYAVEQLDFLEKKIGKENFKVLEKSAGELWKIRNEYVIPLLKKSGMFADPLLDKIVNNENYSKNTIVEYMDKEFGGKTSKFLSGNLLHAIKGTFQGKANPFTETILQDIMLIRATHRNEASKSMVEFLKNSNNDEIKPVDSKIKSASDSDNDIIGFVEIDPMSGKSVVRKFEVPKEVAELLNKDTAKIGKALNVLRMVTAPVKAAMTTLRPAFILANGGFRDPFALAKNIPKANLLSAYKNVLASYPEVWRAVRKGILSDNLKEMYKDKSLIVGRSWNHKDIMSGDDELERITTSYLNKGGDPDKFIKRHVNKILDFIQDIAETTEKATKVAGHKILKEKSPEIGTMERAHMVRNLAGSPNFLDGGTGRLWINNAFLFSNANIQGWRASAEAFGRNKSAYAIKSLLYDFLPKTLMFAAAHGALKSIIGDELSDWFEEAYAQTSEDQKARYRIVPIWKHENGSYTNLKIPKDFTGQATGAIYWHLLSTGKNAVEKKRLAKNIANIFSETFSQSPISISALHPFVSIPIKTSEWLGGGDPVDDWNQSRILPQGVRGAGRDKELPYMLKYAAGRLGLNTVYRAPNKVNLSDKDLWEKMYGVPFMVNPTLSAFFNQTNPNYKPLTDEEIVEKQAKKVKSLDKNEAILEHIKANKSLIVEGKEVDSVKELYAKLVAEGLINRRTQKFRSFYHNYKEKSVKSGLRRTND